VEEKKEQFEPPPNPIRSTDKEVSTEAHSFVTIPLETYHAPHVSPFQCLEEPSYVESFLKNFYIRWRNILLEGYLILKKKGGRDWLDTHMSGKGTVVFLFIFRTTFFIYFSFCYLFACHFIFILFGF
jgi:hypothetical protein